MKLVLERLQPDSICAVNERPEPRIKRGWSAWPPQPQQVNPYETITHSIITLKQPPQTHRVNQTIPTFIWLKWGHSLRLSVKSRQIGPVEVTLFSCN